VHYPPTCTNANIKITTGDQGSAVVTASDRDINDQLSLVIGTVDVSKGTLTGPGSITAGSVISVAQPWTFNYDSTATDGSDVGVYTVTYKARDNAEPPLESGVCTLKITVVAGPVIPDNNPPIGEDFTITINEDEIYDFDLAEHVSDPDGDAISKIIINSWPNAALVNLRDKNGDPIPGNELIPEGSGAFPLRLVTVLNQFGQTTFTYSPVDSKGLQSLLPSTVTIIVKPVNDPPTITVNPLTVTVARLQEGFISFTINDIDSPTLTVSLYANNVPADSTLEYNNPADRKLVTGLPVILTQTATWPATSTDFLVWVPLESIPDGTTGSFQLIVSDSELTGLSQVVNLLVEANIPPITTRPTDVITGAQETPINITLAGYDEDLYHRTTLDVVVTQLPQHGDLFVNGKKVKVGDILPNAVPQADNNGTEAVVTYVPHKFFFGQDLFFFKVVDGADASSIQRKVDIDINVRVDHPPASNDLVLRIQEGYCLLDDCAPATVNPTFAQIFASDPDDDPIKIQFVSLGSAANGTVVLVDSKTNQFVPATPGQIIDGSSLRVYYQPAQYKYSVDPAFYEQVFFKVITSKADGPRDYSITIYVDPVNNPPTGGNKTITTPLNTPVEFSFLFDDVDDPKSSLQIIVVSIPGSNRGTFSENSTAPALIPGTYVPFTGYFVPEQDAYSDTKPIATLQYRVVDPHGAQSPIYYINIVVNFVAYDLTHKNNTHLVTDEDIRLVFKVDRYGEDYFGGNTGLTDVDITISNIVLQDSGNATFQICDPSNQCSPATPGAVPRHSTFVYQDAQDKFGQGRLTFDVTLTAVTGKSITVPYVIDVVPVNDPPVLVPHFNASTTEQKNRCDEDTFIVIKFDGTDVDSPLSSLEGNLVQFLSQGVPGKYYLCDGGDNATKYDDCKAGTLLTQGSFKPDNVGANKAEFSFVFVPAPNANGVARLLVAVVDDRYASSPVHVVEIVVDPINDAPFFVQDKKKLDKSSTRLEIRRNGDQNVLSVFAEVSDILDYRFGRELNVSFHVREEESGSFNTTDEHCGVSADGQTLWCKAKLETLAIILRSGFDYVLNNDRSYGQYNVEYFVDDLGNIDKLNRPLNASILLTIDKEGESLTASTIPKQNNIALIAGPIAGLLAGVAIAGLVFLLRARRQKDAVADYFDKFAVDLTGATNSSPLYKGQTAGGDSPLYKSRDSQDRQSGDQ